MKLASTTNTNTNTAIYNQHDTQSQSQSQYYFRTFFARRVADSVDSFVSIKQAFDVLSSALHKKYYDEALAAATTSTSNWVNSKCLKTDEISLVGSVSTRVHIGDLTKEEVEVEEEGEEDGSGNVTSTTTTNCYTHECRCGDVVEILEEELLLKSNVDCIVKECSSCNLTVVVVLQ